MKERVRAATARLDRWRVMTVLLAGGALFSGVALLTNILAGFSLPLALGLLGVLFAALIVVVGRRVDPADRARLLRIGLTGVAAAFVATLAYDGAKTVLSQLDPSPYNPFEATRIFGTLIIGPEAEPLAIQAVGWSFHLLNGTSFGLAYTLLFGREGRTSVRWALLTGVGWGLFLEMFQLTLYPGWLDIRFYSEFVQISFAAHVVYGASLGILCRHGLRLLVTGGAGGRVETRRAVGSGGR